ncbi:MAG: helix-turn-helix transcriptional regulator [Actinomycetota bacterium]|nr:helix-turn-helix transcriptional regulator [Actinomycetota bacterium]
MTASTTPPRPVLFETRDADLAGEYLTGVYGNSVHTVGRRDGYFLRVQRFETPTFAIDAMTHSDVMAYQIEYLPVLAVVWSQSMNIDFRSEGNRHRFGPGDVFLSSRADPGAPQWSRLHGGGLRIASLPFSLLGQVAATAETSRPEPITFADVRPFRQDAVRQLTATIEFLSTGLRDRPEAMAEPLVASAAGRMLAATILTAFPNNVVTDPTIEDRHDASPATLRRAIAFIEDFADQDISVADIAEAAHVTVRALQYAFRRHRATTPMRYLRRVRLQQAHRDLLAADPVTGITVTEIAARWGFFHPGRFAQQYRAAYGRPPHATLLEGT